MKWHKACDKSSMGMAYLDVGSKLYFKYRSGRTFLYNRQSGKTEEVVSIKASDSNEWKPLNMLEKK